MKKREFKTLALMGLTSGLLISSQASSAQAEAEHNCSGSQLAAGCGSGCKSLNQKSCASCSSLKQQSCSSCSSAARQGCNSHSCSGLTADSEKSSKSPYASPDQKDSNQEYDPNDGNMGYHLMNESELMLELNAEGRKMYNSLTPEGKTLALKVASMRCAGTNDCKNLNACKTDKNDCAGQGQCKGQGKCAVADKNLAVKLVYQKMKAKRDNALQNR